MTKRGRKPIDVGHLSFWEEQWHLAFHHLREGRAMPSHASWWRLSEFERADLRGRLARIERMSPEEYWSDFLSQRPLLKPYDVPLSANAEQATKLREDEIHNLRRRIEPKKIREREGRALIWQSLWKARSVRALRDACRRWKRLGDKATKALAEGRELDVDQSDYATANFPTLLLENEDQFLAMKRDARFPRSENSGSDDARLDYLARGMAGIMIGVSPITAIERLRNKKIHHPGGALWNKKNGGCDCWRCERKRSKKFGDELLKATQEGGPR